MDHRTRSERIALVVDDDAFVLSSMAEVLSDEGYDVHTSSNGFSALRQATEYRPVVIVLDVMLPERSGAEVLADLRSDPATRDIAVVLVTGNPGVLTQAHIAAADGVVTKPFDVNDLVQTVQLAVQRASTRRAEVVPVSVTAHREPATARQRRAAAARHTHGRR